MPRFVSLHPRTLPGRFALAIGAAAAALATVPTGLVSDWRSMLVASGWHLDELLLSVLAPTVAALVMSSRALVQLRLEMAGQTRKSAQAHELALRDPLTGLLNRRGLDEALAKQPGGESHVFVADIDSFKAFNDAHGHVVGDLLLQRLADRLHAMMTTFNAVAARLGGDEFVFVAPAFHEEQVIFGRLRAPLEIEDVGSTGISVGAARCVDIGGVEQALECADLAMYRAKRNRAASRGTSDAPFARVFEREGANNPAMAATHAVVAIGIEQYRSVKHALGYRYAGKLMRAVRERVRARLSSIAVERLGNDVLGLLVPTDDAEAVVAALQGLSGTYSLDDVVVETGLIFGQAVPQPGASLRDTVEQAQSALDEARRLGRVRVHFDNAEQLRQLGNIELMNDLQQAIAADALDLHYQPKIDARTNAVDSFEALARWPHPQRGMVPPCEFIPVAEESGDIRALTFWVLDRACADRARLDARDIRQPLYINISARLVGDQAFADRLIATLLNAGGRIGIEVTETSVLENPERALANLTRINAAGIAIAIDDYGAGLSSLTYLKQMPASELKIDMSFIRDLAESHRDPLIVRSTIDLAHSLGLRVTAEGVDKPEIMALLKVMGCDIIQGHQIARPMPPEALYRFIEGYTPEDLTAQPMAARLLAYAE